MTQPALHFRAIEKASLGASWRRRALIHNWLHSSQRQCTSRSIRQRHRGLLLAEALMASVVLSIAVVGIVGVLDASYTQSSYLRQNATSVSLANQLLSEMAAKPTLPYAASAGAGATNRSLIGSVGDYDGYRDSTSALLLQNGTACEVGGGETYQRKVAVTPYSRPLGDPSSPTDEGDFLLVTVTVTEPSGAAISLSRNFANVTLTR